MQSAEIVLSVVKSKPQNLLVTHLLTDLNEPGASRSVVPEDRAERFLVVVLLIAAHVRRVQRAAANLSQRPKIPRCHLRILGRPIAGKGDGVKDGILDAVILDDPPQSVDYGGQGPFANRIVDVWHVTAEDPF